MPIPFQPSMPAAPCFDSARNAWILSRYRDVSAALNDASLRPTTADNDPTMPEESAQHARLYAEVQADIARLSGDVWQTPMEETLSNLLQQAKRNKCADLVREIIHP